MIDKIEDDINPIEIRVGNHSYIYNKPNKENQTKIDSSSSRDCDDTSSTKKGIAEIMEEVKRKTDKAIEKKKEKVLAVKTLSVARVLDMWKLSLSKTEYTAKTDMVITKAEMGRIKVGLLPTLVLYFIETHGTGIMPEFFDWVTGNWGFIMRTKFKWMTKEEPPMQPNIMFLTNFKKHFLEAYIRKYELAKYDNGTIKGSLIADMMKKGYSYKEIMENMMLTEAINRKKVEAEQMLQHAKKTAKQTENLARKEYIKAEAQVREALYEYRVKSWRSYKDTMVDDVKSAMLKQGLSYDRKTVEGEADKLLEDLIAEFNRVYDENCK